MNGSHSNLVLPAPTSAVRKFASQPAVRHYNRLILSVLAINLWVGWSAWHWWAGPGHGQEPGLQSVVNLVVINLTLAVLIRQQYVINFLFRAATSVPVSWPLLVRRTLAKVYHFGGIHVGAAIAATAWFAVLSVLIMTQSGPGTRGSTQPLTLVTLALLIVLVGIIIMALPPIRMKYHDAFERAHRFGGWAALVLFWLQAILLANSNRGAGVDSESIAAILLHTPSVWALAIVTLSIALPWLRLRRVSLAIVSPSSHVAIARFDHGVNAFPGSSTTLSRNPLLEWHSFANAPTPGVDGFRLTISRAGDWTGSFINDMPDKIWIKGIPTAGVANIEKLFTRVVYVTTGSGIGVCLPHLLANDVPSLLVWATRNPRDTYGDALVNEIIDVQPEAVIWDTEANGKPDMIQLAYQAYIAFAAEAVICISNKRLTWQVVSAMESRGIPAYGAIWDS